MLIDCDTCSARGQACDGCVVNLLFGEAPPAEAFPEPRDPEQRALQVLADAGFEVTVLSRDDSRSRLRLLPGGRRGHHAA
jgi:hypothetical protein